MLSLCRRMKVFMSDGRQPRTHAWRTPLNRMAAGVSRETVGWKASMERFSKLVKLKAFQPFVTSDMALENMKAIAESHVTDDLIQFLDTNLPKMMKKKGKSVNIKLGIADSKLANE